ncbi:carbonic anhydrase 1-like [Uranotaenia lowii]|uniref:carbonic anhydrase 1-like n=1 Tax=Uranotaenia lowii TaxID=190385 RepID=UPI002479E083|nr:carbonic anhydrase 1-like [Uranotaenia lowii]
MSDQQESNEGSQENSSSFSEEISNPIFHYANTEFMQFSPIDINISDATPINFPELEWINYEKVPRKVKVTNTGQTVILSAKYEDEEHPFLRGAFLEERYIFAQLHFHWGNTGAEGSEHTIDESPLPFEIHVVHFKGDYESFDEALQVVGGVLSLVFFYNLKSNPNPFIKPFIDNLSEITFPDTTFKLTPFPLLNMFHTFTSDYLVYWGSTRSGNNQSYPILWLISRTQECIDFNQLTKFRQLLDQRMRVIYREPHEVFKLGNRHLWHVNPKYPCAISTLSVLPHSKYRTDRWLIDRVKIDLGSPGGCKQFIEALREEMNRGRKSAEEKSSEVISNSTL